MSGNRDKKIRQLFRREYAEDVEKIAKAHSQFLKPKPKFIPTSLWVWMLSFFVRIKA